MEDFLARLTRLESRQEALEVHFEHAKRSINEEAQALRQQMDLFGFGRGGRVCATRVEGG